VDSFFVEMYIAVRGEGCLLRKGGTDTQMKQRESKEVSSSRMTNSLPQELIQHIGSFIPRPEKRRVVTVNASFATSSLPSPETPKIMLLGSTEDDPSGVGKWMTITASEI
jgi:hypothetical protein